MKNIEEKNFERTPPNIESGLTTEEVELRKKLEKTNKTKDAVSKSYARIIFENVFTFLNMFVLAIAACFIFLVGPEMIFNISFLGIVTINVCIGTVQECRSKHTIKKLKLMNSERFNVLRNGEIIELLSDDLVQDDIIKLKSGGQIPVDAKILDGKLEVNESLLTGESVPIKKNIGDMLYAGSYVVSGDATVIAEKVGEEKYIYSIESKAKTFKKPKSQLITGINSIIKRLVSIVIPLGILTFWSVLVGNSVSGSSFKDAVKAAGTAMVGMTPVGMILLASVAMAVGVMKLAKKKTLAQDLYSIESLARVDTLCLDKTGTLTDGTMTVEDVTFFSYDTDLKEIVIPSYLSAFSATNQTSDALIEKYGKYRTWKIETDIPFSSDRKFSVVKFRNGRVLALGAPEYLTDNQDILNDAEKKQKNGLRVVCLVELDRIPNEGEHPIGKPIAVFMIRDNIRPEVKSTMEWFDKNDVEIRVISGDNINTVSYIAKQCGIKNWDKCVDLSKVDEKDMKDVIFSNYIFGRVTPEQKALIVDVLHSIGRTVAITGDGVNDLLAMKKADCSVAMANGSAATRNVANIVLMDSNFSNMPETVLEGRRVVNNIQRATTLFLMKNFFMLFATFFCLILRVDLVIETSLMSLFNLLITGLSSFMLSLEPSSQRISGDFKKNVLSRAIPAGFFMFMPYLYLMIRGLISTNLDVIATRNYLISKIPVIALCMIIAAFVIFFKVCKPFTKYRAWLFGIITAIAVAALLIMPDIFLTNSSDFTKELIDKFGFQIDKILMAELERMFKFEVYRDFVLEDWLTIIIFGVLSYILYTIIEKINNYLSNKKGRLQKLFEEE